MIRVIGVPQVLVRFIRASGMGVLAATQGRDALAEEIAGLARLKVPVDTGALRDSIMVAPGRVTVTASYAGLVEYGTSEMSPQPYLRPAADTASGALASARMQQTMRAA